MSNCGIFDALADLAGAARDFLGHAIMNGYQRQIDELFEGKTGAAQVRRILDAPETYAFKGIDAYQLAELLDADIDDGDRFCELLSQRLRLPPGLRFHLVDFGLTDEFDEETLDTFCLFLDEARMYWIVIDEMRPRDERGRFCRDVRPAIAALTA